jgi:CopA family copper-resistance protein
MNFTGRTRPAITVNGSLPAPLLRWREGTTVNLRVSNALPAGSIHGHATSIHWHGILLPANMDGVPGLSFNGIHAARPTISLRRAPGGHVLVPQPFGVQEQAGLYGAADDRSDRRRALRVDRDYVVMLSDWTDSTPRRCSTRLKKMPGTTTLQAHRRRLPARRERDGRRDASPTARCGARMRMTPTDLSDVNANTYTYLMNGTTALGNWTGLFRSGEKVRLRFINGSGMSYFDVRIPGLKMTVVAADGQYVHPVTVDELRIAVAETST